MVRLLKAAPWIAIAVLIAIALWQRNSITDTSARLAASEQQAADLKRANETAQETIRTQAQARADNDRIWAVLAASQGANRDRETHTQTIIKEATHNDPIAKNWADTAIPDSLRNAANPAR